MCSSAKEVGAQMVTARIGDMFDSDATTLVNTVNCVGVMGKGVALGFKKRFPSMYRDYVERCKLGKVRLGVPYLYSDLLGPSIVNFPTKDHWRSPSRLADIEAGLDYLAAHVEEWGITSIAMPPLGCGNGGLAWADVGPLIHSKLAHLPIAVEVYAPYGTPSIQLSEAFLSSRQARLTSRRGSTRSAISEGAIVLLETIRQLYMQPFAQPIGRIKFQKVGYALAVCGGLTDYNFVRGSYGPFSSELRDERNRMANANLLEEEQWGPMFVARTTQEFDDRKHQYDDLLQRYAAAIGKTVDLFARIATTDQAEETATVLFAYNELRHRSAGSVTVEQIVEYVSSWKSRWASDPKRILSVKRTAFDLAALGWADDLSFAEMDQELVDAILET